MTKNNLLINKGINAKRESKYVDFKRSFDPDSNGEWCELIKDIVAMANTGGGIIVIGLNDNSTPSKIDVSPILNLDSAKVTDKINKYTSYQFSDFEIDEGKKGRYKVALMVIKSIYIPLIFQKPGEYIDERGKQKTAFAKGTVYFRHGAKSEPGNMADLQVSIERQVRVARKELMKDLRRVVAAPSGSRVEILTADVTQSTSPSATPIRITDDPEAPGYKLVAPDITHPNRQTELMEKLNNMLPKGVKVNAHDMLAFRKVHQIHEHPEFFYKHKFGSPQYSDAYAEWIFQQYQKNSDIFKEAKRRYKSKDY